METKEGWLGKYQGKLDNKWGKCQGKLDNKINTWVVIESGRQRIGLIC